MIRIRTAAGLVAGAVLGTASTLPVAAPAEAAAVSCRYERLDTTHNWRIDAYESHTYTIARGSPCRHINVRRIRDTTGRPTCVTVTVRIPGMPGETDPRRVCNRWRVAWAGGNGWVGLPEGLPFVIRTDRPVTGQIKT